MLTPAALVSVDVTDHAALVAAVAAGALPLSLLWANLPALRAYAERRGPGAAIPGVTVRWANEPPPSRWRP